MGVGVEGEAWRDLVVGVMGFPGFFGKVVWVRVWEWWGGLEGNSEEAGEKITMEMFEGYYRKWLEVSVLLSPCEALLARNDKQTEPKTSKKPKKRGAFNEEKRKRHNNPSCCLNKPF